MTDRIVDISRCPVRLSVRQKQLVIDQSENPSKNREDRSPRASRARHANGSRSGSRKSPSRRDEVTIPLADLAVVIVSHPQVTYTQAVLASLAESGGAFVACNRQYLPVGLFLPLTAHFTQAERFLAQARAPVPLGKRLWQQIVRSKIKAQARALEVLHGSDFGLLALVSHVRSGDPTNVEARAARRYWPQLFLDLEFRRNPDNQDQNLLLNYGYAVMRAIVARAICAAGLHPSLGVHHHNRYNAFCLADDLMEPFRPVVDCAVVQYMSQHDESYGIEASAKQFLIERITGRYLLDDAMRTLFDVAGRLAASLADAFLSSSGDLALPDWDKTPLASEEEAQEISEDNPT